MFQRIAMSLPHPSRTTLAVAAAAACVIVTGCGSTRLSPMVRADLLTQNISELAAHEGAQEPLTAPLTLEEAMARALKYNLELKSKRIEEAMAADLLSLTKGDMLPKLLGQIGYFERDNDRISLSRDTTVAGSPLVPSRFVSQERSHTLSELGLQWSVLDFGLGYYRSQQQSDRVLIAAERRRKAIHLVLQDVRTAYWRLATAQALETRVQKAIKESEEALRMAKAAEQAGTRNPVAAGRYQRALLENLRLLDAMREELASARIDLAVLINAPVGRKLVVAEPSADDLVGDALGLSYEQLEQAALSNNPDLIEQHYNSRIARIEARAGLLRMFPNLNLGYGLNHDTDRYLLNQSWQQASAQLSLNLLSLLKYPATKAYGEAGVALADERRRLAQVTVVAQVHLSRIQLEAMRQQLFRAREIHETDGRLAQSIGARVAADAESALERISATTAALLSELRYYQARANLHTAHARLIATLGAEPDIPSVTETPLSALTELLRQAKPVLAVPEPAAAAGESNG